MYIVFPCEESFAIVAEDSVGRMIGLVSAPAANTALTSLCA